jgi:hypothetical protein
MNSDGYCIESLRFSIYPHGKWKNPIIAKDQGEFTYPILLTSIIDRYGRFVQVPLAYNHIQSIVGVHILREAIVDRDVRRKPDQEECIRKILRMVEWVRNPYNIQQLRSIYNEMMNKSQSYEDILNMIANDTPNK